MKGLVSVTMKHFKHFNTEYSLFEQSSQERVNMAVKSENPTEGGW